VSAEERGERVRLTALRDEDSDRLFAWINDRGLVVRSAPFRPVARSDHDAWFAAIRKRDDVRIFAIRRLEHDELIGSCQLHSIDPVRRSAELQIRIGERDQQGRGYGHEAVKLLLRNAFERLRLRRVTLHVFESNAPARAVYRKAGFRDEPAPLDQVEIDGRTERVLRMAVGACVVGIHQPNFFPWLGFFDKLRRSDVFVLLDNVPFPNRSRINRSQVLVGDRPQWLTVPIRRSLVGEPVREMLIDEERDWRAKMLKTLGQNYAHAREFQDTMPLLETLIGHRDERLAGYNEHAIRCIADRLGLETTMVRACDLGVQGRATRLLIELVRAVGGTAYLAGGGAAGYQEDELFDDAGLELVYQNFRPPEDVGGLSIIHALFNDAIPEGLC
jgi:RimJ/RimL family protein N-acetyltransferase